MKILVVDDEVEVQQSLKESLERGGYQVLIASDGMQAVEQTKEEEPDLILLDIMLPTLDGYRVLKLLKSDERYRKIPILVITARADAEAWALAMECGATACLSKPVRPQKLLEKINRWLNKGTESRVDAGTS